MRPVFDGHNDALTREDHADLAGGRDGGHLDLPRMRAGGVRGGIFAVFTPSPASTAKGMSRTAALAPRLAAAVSQEEASAHAGAAAGRLLALERSGGVRVARTVEDVDAAHGDPGPPAAVLHLEGAEAIDPALEALDLWHAAGLRSLGPVWSRANAFAHGVPFAAPSSPDIGPGLSAAGRRLVRRCAGAHALCASSRNLTDEQLEAIGASGGLVGIVFAPPFLRADFANDADTPLGLIVEHARYVADRVGIDHVALGSDFDGAKVPAALGDVAGMPKLLAALAAGGFGKSDLDAIAWANWRRVLASWWT